MEKYPSGRRGSPAKGVVRGNRSESSNLSFSAKSPRYAVSGRFFLPFSAIIYTFLIYSTICHIFAVVKKHESNNDNICYLRCYLHAKFVIYRILCHTSLKMYTDHFQTAHQCLFRRSGHKFENVYGSFSNSPSMSLPEGGP